ncbi:MAG: DUF4333 domain-containing protein [Actinomycetota bacterium]|nr:DUF4333 domain-containing protein [Actinomycetota bacterium]
MRRSVRPRLLVAVSVVSVGMFALGACTSKSNTFDQKSLEKAAKDGLQKQVGEPLASVACPANVSTAKGTTFRCTLTATDGSTIGMTGTVKDNNQNFDIVVDQNVASPPTT